MRIVVNALQYRLNGSGISSNLRELFGPFTHITKRPCSVILPKNSPTFPCAKNAERIEAPCPYEAGLRRVLYQSFVLGLRWCSDSILLTLDSKVPLLLPRSCRVIPQITDLALFRMAGTYQTSRVLLWKLQYLFLCRRAEHFLAISEFTKREITELLGIPQTRIDVVPCAASDKMRQVTDRSELEALRKKYDLPERFLLFVGNFNPRKNLERLIRAFDRMKVENGLPHALVIAGGQGWKFNADTALRDVIFKDSVRFIGFVPDDDMSALYSAAELFTFPTLYEGFGIPVIEAQQCGTPVLTSNTSSLPEVGGDAAFYVDPYDEEDIRHGMVELLKNEALRTELIQKGFQNAQRFSWIASARKLDDILEGILNES